MSILGVKLNLINHGLVACESDYLQVFGYPVIQTSWFKVWHFAFKSIQLRFNKSTYKNISKQVANSNYQQYQYTCIYTQHKKKK